MQSFFRYKLHISRFAHSKPHSLIHLYSWLTGLLIHSLPSDSFIHLTKCPICESSSEITEREFASRRPKFLWNFRLFRFCFGIPGIGSQALWRRSASITGWQRCGKRLPQLQLAIGYPRGKKEIIRIDIIWWYMIIYIIYDDIWLYIILYMIIYDCIWLYMIYMMYLE